MAVEYELPRPQSRLKVALIIFFHSSCAIWSTLVSKSALNTLDSPILLLTIQFSVQVLLLTLIGVPLGWVQPSKSLSVCSPSTPKAKPNTPATAAPLTSRPPRPTDLEIAHPADPRARDQRPRKDVLPRQPRRGPVPDRAQPAAALHAGAIGRRSTATALLPTTIPGRRHRRHARLRRGHRRRRARAGAAAGDRQRGGDGGRERRRQAAAPARRRVRVAAGVGERGGRAGAARAAAGGVRRGGHAGGHPAVAGAAGRPVGRGGARPRVPVRRAGGGLRRRAARCRRLRADRRCRPGRPRGCGGPARRRAECAGGSAAARAAGRERRRRRPVHRWWLGYLWLGDRPLCAWRGRWNRVAGDGRGGASG